MENNNPRQNGDPDRRRMIVGIHMGASHITGGLILVGIGLTALYAVRLVEKRPQII